MPDSENKNFLKNGLSATRPRREAFDSASGPTMRNHSVLQVLAPRQEDIDPERLKLFSCPHPQTEDELSRNYERQEIS